MEVEGIGDRAVFASPEGRLLWFFSGGHRVVIEGPAEGGGRENVEHLARLVAARIQRGWHVPSAPTVGAVNRRPDTARVRSSGPSDLDGCVLGVGAPESGCGE